MIRHLEEAFARARELPAEEQASLRALFYAEIDGDAKWDAVPSAVAGKVGEVSGSGVGGA